MTRNCADPLAIARRYAADPASWPVPAQFDPLERWYARLAGTDEHEIWLLTWLPGQSTDLHDHGGSSGAFVVASGALTEEIVSRRPAPAHRAARRHRPAVRPATRAPGQQPGQRAGGECARLPARAAPDDPLRTRRWQAAGGRGGRSGSRLVSGGTAPGGCEVRRETGSRERRDRTVKLSNPPHRQEGCPGALAPVGSRGIDDILASARLRLHRLDPEAGHLAYRGGALLVDIRPAAQRAATGSIPGALVIERNVLEWRFDPRSDGPAAGRGPLRPARGHLLPGGLHLLARRRRTPGPRPVPGHRHRGRLRRLAARRSPGVRSDRCLRPPDHRAAGPSATAGRAYP